MRREWSVWLTKHSGCTPSAVSPCRVIAAVLVLYRPFGAASTSAGKSASVYVSPNALYVPSGVNTSRTASMSREQLLDLDDVGDVRRVHRAPLLCVQAGSGGPSPARC
jgi:hypothetical protein